MFSMIISLRDHGLHNIQIDDRETLII